MNQLHVRALSSDEEEVLKAMVDAGGKVAYRAKVAILSSQGHTVRDVGRMIGLKLDHVRGWIRRFNAKGIDGLKDRAMVRSLTRDEKNALEVMEKTGNSTAYRAKIILLSSEWYEAKEVARMVGVDVGTVRGWIHRFNAQGIGGLRERRGMVALP